jgi:hypothetical protein
MAKVALDAWDYKDKHIDSKINENQFMSSARCIIYAAPNYGDTTADNFGTFSPIGVIQGYNWSEQRQIDLIFELGSDIPYLIPGRTTGQISISRMLLYGRDLINTLYGTDVSDSDTWIKSIKDITKPINMLFATFSNTNSADTQQLVYSRLFRACWVNARNESIAAGQTLIAENCNIMYQDIPEIEITANPAQ